MDTPTNHTSLNGAPGGGLLAGQTMGGGRFLLKKVIGQGGMGVVWLAHDLRLQEPAALKFLPPQLCFDPGALEDLRAETLRSRKLSHPNIVRIHDLWVSKDEPAFISMEYVDGLNLHQLREARPLKVLSWSYLLPLLRQLCAALEYAHSEKVVHSDLKPANMLVDSSGRLKLTDFGLARVAHDSLTRLTGQQTAGGTINFMSPQQADGKGALPSDDIYSLGATIYDLLTSRPPFYQGDVGYQVRHTQPDSMPERLIELGQTNEIPPEVSALVMACLSKESGARPASARAILDFLDASEKNLPVAIVAGLDTAESTGEVPPISEATAPGAPPASPARIDASTGEVPPTMDFPEADEPLESRRSVHRQILAGIVLLLMIASAAVIGVWMGKRLDRRVAESSPKATAPALTPNVPVQPEAVATPPSRPPLAQPPPTGPVSGHWETCPKLPSQRIYHTAVWTGKEMIIWGGGARGVYLSDGAAYDPVKRTWRVISSQGAPSARWCHTAFWTGREMIVWGGRSAFGAAGNKRDGALYDPSTDRWRPMNLQGAPAARSQMGSVWTGNELIVWGGWGDNDLVVADGARYNVESGHWAALPANRAPAARLDCIACWTGEEMLVWGGYLGAGRQHAPVAGGARYNPQSNTWRPMGAQSDPGPRRWATGVWTGREMLLCGGAGIDTTPYAESWRYTPGTDSWTKIPDASPLAASCMSKGVWTGREMILWGGTARGGNQFLKTGVCYDPVQNRWRPLAGVNAPDARAFHTAVWTGQSMLVFGGSTGGFEAFDSTAAYVLNPESEQ